MVYTSLLQHTDQWLSLLFVCQTLCNISEIINFKNFQILSKASKVITWYTVYTLCCHKKACTPSLESHTSRQAKIGSEKRNQNKSLNKINYFMGSIFGMMM